ncbi:hypothetical protein OG225_41225 (plasmid) [Nocardia sp. NBC_01377]|uniref:hypothetical protein n=1 Tax=Nocardia sp. NBC_01377 TaxID=2903595 RepID=UPI002F917605
MTDRSNRRVEGSPATHGAGSPQIGRLGAQSAQLAGHPVIVMVQPDTHSYVGRDGHRLIGDSTEFAVREHGARPIAPPDFSFPGDPAPQWQAHLTYATDELLIHFPGGSVMYDGTMPTTANWRAAAASSRGIVMITGPIAAVSAIEPVIIGGRASWIRLPLICE